MRTQSIVKVLGFVVCLFVLLGGIGLGLVLLDIQKSVNENIQIAQQAHPVKADDTASLIAYVNSERHNLKEKNHAVWTLGRIKDARAVEVLKSHYTGNECDHDEKLCQSELRKAIARCSE
ncbi:MAG: hypothetical protein FVQ79_05595 [Planctomycetes bacterium]|nr:hypothetical protein [Planctomycetota bacterium]